MKRLRYLLKSFVVRHIAAPEPVFASECIYRPTPDIELIRFAVWLHFRSRNISGRFLLHFDPLYDHIVNGLRLEGWTVQLQGHEDGQLAYSISPSRAVVAV